MLPAKLTSPTLTVLTKLTSYVYDVCGQTVIFLNVFSHQLNPNSVVSMLISVSVSLIYMLPARFISNMLTVLALDVYLRPLGKEKFNTRYFLP